MKNKLALYFLIPFLFIISCNKDIPISPNYSGMENVAGSDSDKPVYPDYIVSKDDSEHPLQDSDIKMIEADSDYSTDIDSEIPDIDKNLTIGDCYKCADAPKRIIVCCDSTSTVFNKCFAECLQDSNVMCFSIKMGKCGDGEQENPDVTDEVSDDATFDEDIGEPVSDTDEGVIEIDSDSLLTDSDEPPESVDKEDEVEDEDIESNNFCDCTPKDLDAFYCIDTGEQYISECLANCYCPNRYRRVLD